MQRHTTWEDVNSTSMRAGVAQYAWHPQHHHRVDGHDVAHVLVEVEVLQQKPGGEARQRQEIGVSLLVLRRSGGIKENTSS